MIRIRPLKTNQKVADAFAALKARGADLAPVMDEIGAYMVDATLERFQKGVAPSGKPWPRSGRVAEAQGNAQTLVDSGMLRDSITHIADRNSATIGTNIAYAGIHQYGGTITARNSDYLMFAIGGRFAKVKSVTIPARPFLGINTEDEQEFINIASDYLKGALH